MCIAKENLVNKEKEMKQQQSGGGSSNNWTHIFRKVSFVHIISCIFCRCCRNRKCSFNELK